MKYSGPAGIPRLTSLGPLVKQVEVTPEELPPEAERLESQGMTREEFMERCKDSDWAVNWSENWVRSLGIDPEDVDLENLKGDACEDIADELGIQRS